MNTLVVYLQARRHYGILPIEIEEISSKKELESFMQRLEFGEDERFINTVTVTFCNFNTKERNYSFEHEQIYNADGNGIYYDWQEVFRKKSIEHLKG